MTPSGPHATPQNAFHALAGILERLVAAAYCQAEQGQWEAQPGSPAAAEIAEDVGLGGSWGSQPVRDASTDIAFSAIGTLDHVSSLAVLFREPSTGLFGSYTLARSAFETACRTCYLLAPGIGARERVRRYTNERLYSIHEHMNLVASFGEEQQVLERARNRIDELLRGARENGLGATRSKGTKNPPYIGSKRPGPMQVTEQIMEEFSTQQGYGSFTFRLLSAWPHGTLYSGRMLLPSESDIEPSPDGIVSLRLQDSVPMAATRLINLIVAIFLMIDRLTSYYGYDQKKWRDAGESLVHEWFAWSKSDG